MVVRCWLRYTNSLEGLGIEYSDCPQHCPRAKDEGKKPYDIYRYELCGGCPAKRRKREFESNTINAWELWFTPEDFAPLKFSKYLETLNTVLGIKDLPADKMSEHSAMLVGIFDSEKARYEKEIRLSNPNG